MPEARSWAKQSARIFVCPGEVTRPPPAQCEIRIKKLMPAGGSSSGSGALVAAKIVDMAIGGDQGGSIRMPSCWCGIYGHKPTYGLVPYTGAFPIELTVDHVGPMARTVADIALMLEVSQVLMDSIHASSAGLKTRRTPKL